MSDSLYNYIFIRQNSTILPYQTILEFPYFFNENVLFL